jgi:hypothetical protein
MISKGKSAASGLQVGSVRVAGFAGGNLSDGGLCYFAETVKRTVARSGSSSNICGIVSRNAGK